MSLLTQHPKTAIDLVKSPVLYWRKRDQTWSKICMLLLIRKTSLRQKATTCSVQRCITLCALTSHVRYSMIYIYCRTNLEIFTSSTYRCYWCNAYKVMTFCVCFEWFPIHFNARFSQIIWCKNVFLTRTFSLFLQISSINLSVYHVVYQDANLNMYNDISH